jgi:hypothetical protein
MIKKLTGLEITSKDIIHANKIIKTRIPKKEYYDIKNVTTIELLAEYYDTSVHTLNLIIADDWYLLYESEEDRIDLLEWYSLKNAKMSMKRTIEMLSAFKEILIENKNKLFYAEMIHTTSFKLYSFLQEKGLLEEISHSCEFNASAYEKIPEIAEEITSLFNSITLVDFLKKSEFKKYEQYLQFIIHNISFKISDKFFEKDGTLSLKRTKSKLI